MAEIDPPLRTEDYFDKDGRPTLRFSEFLEGLTTEVNIQSESTDSTFLEFGAKIADMQERLGSGDALTWDDDGFTWDTDQFSWDQDEA